MRRHLARAVVAMAALTLLTACAGSPVDTGTEPATGNMKDAAGAPAPQNGPPQELTEQRDVVKTASMTITVASTSEAADKAAVIVENADGRVDSRSEDSGSGQGRALTSIVLRVPAPKLDAVVRELKTLGTVQTAETRSEDVTAQRVDLDARIKALQTSVDRLLTIMRDARDPEALIAAENALSQRQADLDSLRAQRDQLGDRIDYSTVDVTFVAERVGGPSPQQYQGFLGQVERGWDALVSVTGTLFLLVGLLLPWLAVLAVFAMAGYALIRVVRSRRS
ncbi:DUF4349 domain-containing protein [Mycolicibacterium arseniciresistens]